MLDMAAREESQKCVLSEIMTTPKKTGLPNRAIRNRALQQHEWGSMRGSPRAFRGWDTKPFQKDRGSKDRDYVVEWGVRMFIFSICCVFCMLLAVALPFMLMDGADAEADRVFLENWIYYCALLPLTVPVALTAVYLHWVGMKLFKHA